jgi:hypothetical protein
MFQALGLAEYKCAIVSALEPHAKEFFQLTGIYTRRNGFD